jgi:ABC-2 type transport system ATP-binding protein
VLSDAEALCNRVAILVGGSLVATGATADVRAFSARGWEMVMSSMTAGMLERHRPRIQRVTPIAEGRYALELPLQPNPDALLRDLIAEGAQLVSLNPLRETLEDYFVELVKQHPGRRRDDVKIRESA